ncbi:VWA domain-containing protein [Halomonas campisalis]|uniref:VWA domain-containing protein n=1 Tax=Billgrantia campisalis TaxID=74661 RepID=A0ABS9P675_9GAMM|nr:vWA domain-containing protein [Halomonas campisalis]MCG6657263.1 VWA domain-containing protein [Halomonas campisalis]MDR5864195.1 VWA domain-containing protein [Halomonas campisalis]
MGWNWIRGCRRLAALAGTTLLTVSLLASPLPAAPPQESPDVRVIVDVSGSMRHNDPEQLAADALELLVALLPAGVSAGVWTFGETVANPLPLGRVDAEWRERALALRPRLVDYQPFTDIEAAVREAARAEADGWRHLVLLTDGMIDLPPWRGAKPEIDAASRQSLLDTLAPRLAEQGVVVHAIAFSEEADLDLVERLARQTAGLSAPVDAPDALLGAFVNIVDRIFAPERVPLSEGSFLIEPGLESFTALLFHEGASPTLIAPDGSRHAAAAVPEGWRWRWRSEPRYELIQVPEPMPGQWRLEGHLGQDSRITVVSPLSLQTAGLPGTLYLGFDVPVQAWLVREGERLVGEDLPPHLQVTAELRDEAGRVQSAMVLEPVDGRFAGVLPAPALTGTAQLVVFAEGQGLRRQRSQPVNVQPAIAAQHDPAANRVLLRAEHPLLHGDNARLHGELQGERLVAEALEERRWVIALPDLDAELSQPLMLRAQITLEGRTRELRLPRLILFPDGATGIDQAGAAPVLAVERFHEELTPVREPPPADTLGAAERLIAAVDGLWQRAWRQWYGTYPQRQRLWEAYGRDPRLWAAALLAVGLALLGLKWRRRRRTTRIIHREEPHV